MFLIIIITFILFLIFPPVAIGFLIVASILNAIGKSRREIKKLRKEIKKGR